jgi:hypothetical protein
MKINFATTKLIPNTGLSKPLALQEVETPQDFKMIDRLSPLPTGHLYPSGDVTYNYFG